MTTYFIIRNKKTGKFVKRSKHSYPKNQYVSSASDATLIRSSSAATQVVQALDSGIPHNQRYLTRRKSWYPGDHETIAVNVLIYPEGTQPFIDGVLNGKP